MGGRGTWRAQGWSEAKALRANQATRLRSSSVAKPVSYGRHEKRLIFCRWPQSVDGFHGANMASPSPGHRLRAWRALARPLPRRRRERGARQAWPLRTAGRGVAGRGPRDTAGRRRARAMTDGVPNGAGGGSGKGRDSAGGGRWGAGHDRWFSARQAKPRRFAQRGAANPTPFELRANGNCASLAWRGRTGAGLAISHALARRAAST